jgi:TetR/AcrR family transcriptional repressor of nem operon
MINAALQLFHEQGVNATSVDQVLERSETGKGQFTHYFKTKEGLVHAVLQFLHDVIKSGQTATGYTLKTWKDLDNWFLNYINFQRMTEFELSCPIGTIGNDISDEQQLLRQDVKLFLEWARTELAKFFSEKKSSGELQPTVSPESLADFCISIMQGGMLLTKIKRDPDMFINAAREANNYIKSLRVPKKSLRNSRA